MFASECSVEDMIVAGARYFEEASLYFGHGTDNAMDEAAVLVAHVLSYDWETLLANLEQRMNTAQQEKAQALFNLRVEKAVPAAYLTGEAWFAGMKFKADKRALVPRSPLAELIRQRCRPWLHAEPKRILDLCCGGGCIGLACAKYFEEAEVLLSDISEEALVLARENIQLHGMQSRVTAQYSDAFQSLEGRFDLIISNPPYVDARDLATMPREYHAEPAIALGSGEDGLDFTRTILQHAEKYLNPKGTLIVEIGNSAEALEAQLPEVPFMWPEFEHGGHGVFILSFDDLKKYRELFKNF